jgi:hypothetical protein
MSFKAYSQNIEAKSGKSLKEYYALAEKKGFIIEREIVAAHAQMLKWLKSDMALRHVYANFVISYFKLRTHDPKVTEKMRTWAYSTGYSDSE